MRIDGRERSSSRRMMLSAEAILICTCIIIPALAAHHDHHHHWSVPALQNSHPATVIPRKVTSQGHFISHNLTQYHAVLQPDGVIAETTTKVHYVIPIPTAIEEGNRQTTTTTTNDEDLLQVELKPSKRLTRASTLVETIGRTGDEKTSAFTRLENDKLCQYVGKVKGDDLSKVALSTCDGLNSKRSPPLLIYCPKSGYIRTKRGYYLIHPITSSKHITNATHAWGTPQPHHIYPFESDTPPTDEPAAISMMMRDDGRWNRDSVSTSNTTQVPLEDTEELYIEAMVVLDNSMMKHHKEIDLENYILTVFNMAHSLFHDTSLGRNINLAIVRLVRLEHEDYESFQRILRNTTCKNFYFAAISPTGRSYYNYYYGPIRSILLKNESQLNLALNKNPQKTLDYFVGWQQKINPKDDAHPNHHDMAILITRLDVCDDTKMCGWLGAARVGGICDPNHQVAICQDVGLRLGFVVAHQIGHALGLPHDTIEECGCKDTAKGGAYTVMSPRMSSRTAFWSNCSRDALRDFLNSGFGKCLHDEPTEHSFELQDVLPGVMYDAHYQCRTLLGPTAAQCMTGMDCSNLICYIEDKGCVEMHVAVAPGTKCAEKKWCVKGTCVFEGERPGAVHGGWGEWGEWSTCSRTCGSGVASQTRHCDNPIPSGGGRYCIGEHNRHKICSTDPCDLNEPSFRDVQCAEFNSWVYPEDGKIHEWRNYPIHDENPCLLFCVNDEGTVASLRPRVIDGTKCQYGMRDICINGLCKEIPCDLNLESNAVEDRCGVCQGDGNSCRIFEGRKYFSCTQYVVNRRFTHIPKGAVNIKIEEMMPSESRIQVRDSEGNILFCGGDDLGLFSVPGSKAWIGMIRAEQEAVSIPGPIDENITIWIDLMQNVSVKYSYGMPVPKAHRHHTRFTWDYVDWSRCSAECGIGTQTAHPVCVEHRSGLVDEKYCANLTRPKELVRGCEMAPCTPRWFMGDWLPCDCRHSKQTRIVLCVRPTGEGEGEVNIIDNVACVQPKPKIKQKCKCRPGRQVAMVKLGGGNNWPVVGIPWQYVGGPNVVYWNIEGRRGATEVDNANGMNYVPSIYSNQSAMDANITSIINQTSFINDSAPFNVTKANLTNLLKDESSVDIDALCKDMSKKFDLKSSKNNTVIDFDNATLVELTVHADLVNGELPEDLPQHGNKHYSNDTWYKISGKEAMHFISHMQKTYGEENKTQIR